MFAECLTRVYPAHEAFGAGGSGFWVAPGVVLTCAHVVPGGLDAAVYVEWRGEPLPGTVVAHTPTTLNHGLWNYPDLAVIRVDGYPQHPCVWLSETVPNWATRIGVVALGHSSSLGEELKPMGIRAEISGWHGFGPGRYWQLKGNEVVAGMSGGPVLDLSTGAVCAIVTTTIGEGADRGGYAVPIGATRQLPAPIRQQLFAEHDRFHADHRDWTHLRASFPPEALLRRSGLSPEAETDLLGLLAEFQEPEDDELLRLFWSSSSSRRDPRDAVSSYRDVAYELMDEGIGPLLQMLHRLADDHHTSPSGRNLSDLAAELAMDHGLRPMLQAWRAARSDRQALSGGVVRVQVAPGNADTNLYRLTVSIRDSTDRWQCLHADNEPVRTRVAIMRLAVDRIHKALCRLQGDALVEFVVPFELFDERFEDLVPEGKRYRLTTLGRAHRVVLRDLDRFEDQSIWHGWQRRWQHLRGTMPTARWLTCRDSVSPADLVADFEIDLRTGMVALTRSPSANVRAAQLLRVALDSGVAVAVWRRGGCPVHDDRVVGAECSGKRFRGALTRVLGTSTVEEIPETIRLLRARAAKEHARPIDAHCGDLVLLWDDPHSSGLPLAPIMEPPRSIQEH